MNILCKQLLMAVVMVCALTACGGGGGGGNATPVAKTVVSGIATKGPFAKDSTVSVFSVLNGTKGALITQAKVTDDNGSYSADLGSYSGAIIVEVSGSYRDEATGNIVTVQPTAPIRAALPLVQGAVSLPVTPLTELAVQKTGGMLTADAITAANALVSSAFKVDITNTLPVVPTAAALTTTTQAQKDYTLALAAVSQMASVVTGSNDTEKLNTVLTTLTQEISSTGMSANAAANFQTALSDFVNPANPNNLTGINTTTTTNLVNVGTLSKNYTLALQGNLSNITVKGIQFDLELPAGVTVNIDVADSAVLDNSLGKASGATVDALLVGKYSAGSLAIGYMANSAINAGSFATLTCNIPAGATLPASSAFFVKNLRVVNEKGVSVEGATVIVN